ncbi:hypothetical protein DID74_01725 [Candidatus Marinamargulisbacteria bacterium SCGC AG-333-B06]|nr:hypothetical protein DID74_01725 [Candidatus Marinamargulisbacteria bacterium SCGC AG-333-B06]
MTYHSQKKKLKLDKKLAFRKEKIKAFLKKSNDIQINVKTKKGNVVASFPLNLGFIFLLFAPLLIGFCASIAFILNYEIELES